MTINDTAFTLYPGRTPLLISLPHVGTELPAELAARMADRAQAVEDTDWHLEPLYRFALAMGAGLLVPRYSRYVVDLNRPAQNTPMYPGQNNTGLCPERFFTGEPLYLPGQEPDATEVAQRVASIWRPYHQVLDGELQGLRRHFGHAVLFDAHSIKSELPWLFEGRLWDLNLGTVDGDSCAPALQHAVATLLQGQTRYSQVVNRRFKGGHITRSYGQPERGVHALQLEMCWRCYMEEDPPYAWHPARAAEVQPLLRQLVQAMIDWRP